jgi:hypothetical protein
MKFIEMSGATFIHTLKLDEFQPEDVKAAGVTERCVVRINQQGDIEVRRPDRWDVIGGLLGDFEHRVKRATGMDWA